MRQYTEYVKQFTRAKANAEFQQLNRPAFDGYYLREENGNILYTAPDWHRLSHADQQVRGGGDGGVRMGARVRNSSSSTIL